MMAGIAAVVLALVAVAGPAQAPGPRWFETPEAAVRALIDAAKSQDLEGLRTLLGPDADPLIASSDAATARRNREVFAVAAAEAWRLVDRPAGGKELVVGNEAWPFPIPIVKSGDRWAFDTAAGKEEVLARRIGRNELAALRVCQAYVLAQRAYGGSGHDGKPAGRYARRFSSDPGTHNGLYWPADHGQPRSPLGALVAQAAEDGYQLDRPGRRPEPFHGYYFRILEGQGAGAPGGARGYVVNGEMSGGFAMVAWPAQYDATGVVTFIVNQDGIVYERDLGPETEAAAGAIRRYDPDRTWRKAERTN